MRLMQVSGMFATAVLPASVLVAIADRGAGLVMVVLRQSVHLFLGALLPRHQRANRDLTHYVRAL